MSDVTILWAPLHFNNSFNDLEEAGLRREWNSEWICKDQKDRRKQPWSHALLKPTLLLLLYHKALPERERMKGEEENEKTNWLGMVKAQVRKKMVQVPQKQKYVGKEPEGQLEQSTCNSTLHLPGGTQWASGHHSLVLCPQVGMKKRKQTSPSIESPPSSSFFQPMWMPKAVGIWWGRPMGAWGPDEERPHNQRQVMGQRRRLWSIMAQWSVGPLNVLKIPKKLKKTKPHSTKSDLLRF